MTRAALTRPARTSRPSQLRLASGLGKDTFARVLAQGLGTADLGGAWTVSGAASRYSVSGGVGNWIMQGPGNAPGAYLKNVLAADTDLSFKVSLDKPATGGGVYLAAVGTFGCQPGGVPGQGPVHLGRQDVPRHRQDHAAGVETYLAPETVIAGLTGTNSQQLGVRIQVTGQGTTAIKAKLWATSGAEPAAWQLEATDTTAELQAPGYTGVLSLLSGSATNAPVTARLSNCPSPLPVEKGTGPCRQPTMPAARRPRPAPRTHECVRVRSGDGRGARCRLGIFPAGRRARG